MKDVIINILLFLLFVIVGVPAYILIMLPFLLLTNFYKYIILPIALSGREEWAKQYAEGENK